MKLHSNSYKFLTETLSEYRTEELNFRKVIDSPLIHLYPHSDTCNDNGELDGYIDSLFFEAEIYDANNNIRYTTDDLHDSISTLSARLWQTRIFKDGSTLLIFKGNHAVFSGQSIEVMLKGE